MAAIAVPAEGVAQTKRAFLVGINDYRNVDKLQKAVGDVQAMKAALEKLGFTVDLLTDPDRRMLSVGLSDFTAKIQKGDVALVQFSGHGVAVDGDNYLLPADIPKPGSGDKELLKSESLGLTSLMERVRGPEPAAAIFIIDACRENPFAKAGTRSIGTRGGLANIEAGGVKGGVFIMYSAGFGQLAVDRLSDADPEPTSIYTRTLLRKISVEGKPITDVAREVREDVEALAASINHQQRPAYYDEMSGPIFYFVPPSGKVAGGGDAQNIELTFWNSINDSRNAIMYRDYLAKFGERGVFAGIAKARIAELDAAALAPVAAAVSPGAAPKAPVVAPPTPAVEAALASASFQPSFECKDDGGVVERMVCNNTGLASRDRILSALFYKKVEELPDSDRAQLRQSQRDWLARRNACGSLTASLASSCVTLIYEDRIAELRGAPNVVAAATPQVASTRVVGPPSFDCGGKLSAVETAICGDVGLSGRDRNLADLFKRISQSLEPAARQLFLEGQRAWVRVRNQCQNPNMVGCLNSIYDRRIAELTAATGNR